MTPEQLEKLKCKEVTTLAAINAAKTAYSHAYNVYEVAADVYSNAYKSYEAVLEQLKGE